jgi:hypothetical protein
MSAPALSAFRTCPATGRTIHLSAEALVKANAVVAIVSLLIGTIAALLLVLTRWQAVHLLPATWYYRLLGRARHEHADLLHHLLRDGGAVVHEHRVAQCAPCGSAIWLVQFRVDVARYAHRGMGAVERTSGRPLHVIPAAQGAPPVLLGCHLLCRRRAVGDVPVLRDAGDRQAREDV